MREKFNFFGRFDSHYTWYETNTAFHKKNVSQTQWLQCGRLPCFTASASGRLADGITNSGLYQKILKEKSPTISLCPEAHEQLGYAAEQ